MVTVKEAAPGMRARLEDRSRQDAKPNGGHLYAVDVVRLLTIIGVIVVHSTSLTSSGTDATGAVLIVTHVTRDVFLFLSAFVLGYSTLARPARPMSFWRRRYPLVVVPYAVWSLIYVLTGGDLGSPLHDVGRYLLDLTDGGAHFHLYFLLLTLQLYLVFPALFRFLVGRPRAQIPVLAASVVFQLGFSAAIHYGWNPAVLGVWLAHPGSWLPSYELYVVGGVLGAIHFEAVTAWVRAHSRLIAVAFLGSIGLAIASYLVDLGVLDDGILRASGVFQPVTVVEAATGILAQYAFGLWLVDRVGERRLAQLKATSDASFGVYLAHPLVISAVLDVAGAAGIKTALGGWPSGLVEAIVVVGLVPFVYAVTLAAVLLARRTRLSLPLTGRRLAPGARVSTADGARSPDRERSSPTPTVSVPDADPTIATP